MGRSSAPSPGRERRCVPRPGKVHNQHSLRQLKFDSSLGYPGEGPSSDSDSVSEPGSFLEFMTCVGPYRREVVAARSPAAEDNGRPPDWFKAEGLEQDLSHAFGDEVDPCSETGTSKGPVLPSNTMAGEGSDCPGGTSREPVMVLSNKGHRDAYFHASRTDGLLASSVPSNQVHSATLTRQRGEGELELSESSPWQSGRSPAYLQRARRNFDRHYGQNPRRRGSDISSDSAPLSISPCDDKQLDDMMTREAAQQEKEQRRDAAQSQVAEPPHGQIDCAHFTSITTGREMLRGKGSLMYYNLDNLYLVRDDQIICP